MQQPLWVPSEERKRRANITRFIDFVNHRHNLCLSGYNELYQWSIDYIPDFWADIWDFMDIKASQPYERVVDSLDSIMDASWFPGARLNFAENLLRFRDEKTAIIFRGENGKRSQMSYSELYTEVSRLARALRDFGICPGDRVGGYLPNIPETVIAMLASTSIGAIWSSCSPDFGFQGVIDRFGQIEPRFLFCTDGYNYNGKEYDILDKVDTVARRIKSIEKVVVVPFLKDKPIINNIPGAEYYKDFVGAAPPTDLEFEQLPFDHPVYILYSSGTTGVPKCIVHGAGGTLLQHMKELVLHSDLTRNDTIFYYTTCGWMMWPWLISSLAVGATVYLYDGSPFYPDPGALFRLAQDEGISVFGTSAKYLANLEKEGVRPGSQYDLSRLRAILSTGSPLSVDSFNYVYREIKQDLILSSISGGTDIISCFAVGNPIGPVYPGELQCRGLGMKVLAFDETGHPVINRKGELVCAAPFPSRPVSFWNDPERKKYREAYFNVYPDIWHHGDYIEITDTGGVIIYGRSDATLNPGGVRIGTAEIYRQIEGFPEILDSLVVGQNWQNDVRVILFVKLKPGQTLTEELKQTIKQKIRRNTTPRHVPAKIIQIPDIPYTLNGKKVEIAVRKVIHNEPVLNTDALANPETLEYYRDLPELKE